MAKIAMIDYGAGNICSVKNAIQKICDLYFPQDTLLITHDPADILAADYLILPGVGSFKACMDGVLKHPNLKQALDQAVRHDKKLFLGICVGMQLLAEIGHEYGHSKGLGYMPSEVVAFDIDHSFKIPHMGWNKLHITQEHPIFKGVAQDSYIYFVHSYHFSPQTPEHLVYATADYGISFPAIVIDDNIIGMQFHPEKSHDVGLNLLRNFLAWNR